MRVVARVIEEVEGKRPHSLYSEKFFEMVLKTLPIERQKELVWCAAMGGLTMFFSVPFEEELFTRFYREAPAQLLKYWATKFYDVATLKSLLDKMDAAGGQKSRDQIKLHECYKQLEALGWISSLAVDELLHSWEER